MLDDFIALTFFQILAAAVPGEESEKFLTSRLVLARTREINGACMSLSCCWLLLGAEIKGLLWRRGQPH